MARGDLVVLHQNVAEGAGAKLYNVAAGTLIYAGEPVQVRALGSTTVQPALTSTPDATAYLYVGVAATDSTNTASAAGTVYVTPLNSGITYLANPAVAATWDTQAEYDALVGKRVLLQNDVTVTATPTSGTYTILASDSANNGCVIQPLDVAKYPGKVAFCFRSGAGYLS